MPYVDVFEINVRCTRRTALVAGAAGSAALLLPPALAVPAAAQDRVHPGLRREPWAALIGESVTVGGATLRVAGVGDLAHAKVRGLTGSDEAFVVSLTGSGSGDGIHTVAHPSFGDVGLFVSRVGPAEDRTYELLVDRSVKLPRAVGPATAGDNVPASSAPVEPLPADTPVAAASRKAVKLRYRFLRTARVRRVRGRRRAELSFLKSARVQEVAVRVQRGDVVYATGAAVAVSNTADVRLRPRRPMPRGHYSLVVTVEDRAGRVTTSRRTIAVR